MPGTPNPQITAAVRAYYKVFMDPREIQVRVATDFGVTERTVRRYLAAVVAAAANERTPEQKAARWNQMYATARAALMKCLASGDQRNADKWAERICKMEGMYAPLQVSGPGGGPIQTDGVVLSTGVDLDKLKSADRRGRLMALIEKATAGKKAS